MGSEHFGGSTSRAEFFVGRLRRQGRNYRGRRLEDVGTWKEVRHWRGSSLAGRPGMEPSHVLARNAPPLINGYFHMGLRFAITAHVKITEPVIF
jgi:hypothetical protein